METRSRKHGIVWGSLMIFFGVLSLLETYTDLSVWTWVVILAAGGLGVFGIYLTDRSDWGLLIPAYVLWAVAGLIALIELNVLQGETIATYVLSAIALPFLVVYVRKREWWALIPAYVLLVVGGMVWLIAFGVLTDLLIPAYVLFAIALPFLLVYARNPSEWWSLIPGGILATIGLVFLIAESTAQFLGPVVLILVGAWIMFRQVKGK